MSGRYTVNAAAKQSLSQPIGCQLPLHKGAFRPHPHNRKNACIAPIKSVQASIIFYPNPPLRISRFWVGVSYRLDMIKADL